MKNRMMSMPVVQADVLNFMRTGQKKLTGKVGELQAEAQKNGVPVIPEETVVFLRFLLGQLKPKNILEVGTAVGFSASLMAELMDGQGHVTTIDRFDVMIEKAKKNFEALGATDQVTLLEGQGADILPTLEGPYDFIFMDSAKSKYIEFLPDCLRLVKTGGVIMIDDVLQAGTIFKPIEEIHRSQRAIHRKLNELFDKVMAHPDLTASLVPLGDGVLLITKDKDNVTI